MDNKISAIIPAAGKGKRLKPLTDYLPKELLILGNKPILGYILETLSLSQIKDVCVVVGYKKGEIIDYAKDGSDFGLNICYVYQKEALGLGHAVYITHNYIKTDYILVFLGDVLVLPSIIIKDMVNYFFDNHSDKDGLILVETVNNPERFGVVKFNDDLIIKDLYEKPKDEKIKRDFLVNGKYYAISGIYIFHKSIFDYLSKTEPGVNNEIQLTDAIRLAVKDGRKFAIYKHNGLKLDIGTYDSYLEAQKLILEYKKNNKDLNF